MGWVIVGWTLKANIYGVGLDMLNAKVLKQFLRKIDFSRTLTDIALSTNDRKFLLNLFKIMWKVKILISLLLLLVTCSIHFSCCFQKSSSDVVFAICHSVEPIYRVQWKTVFFETWRNQQNRFYFFLIRSQLKKY